MRVTKEGEGSCEYQTGYKNKQKIKGDTEHDNFSQYHLTVFILSWLLFFYFRLAFSSATGTEGIREHGIKRTAFAWIFILFFLDCRVTVSQWRLS
ncbi:hypothetical protein B0T26DRAFT_712390 [Lasiosphaeria miniovina]|uniref:Uncharacterized protein n=1 Tax=Lasiosphaeria miniovina TaxID=1954250 RepID=A0AA40ALT2_9PEZI|nr:uncharacterized protein B0T26DRAFT_712390 [Lasiosphaeria miniovina]KAK0718223.1 hypothetical protein B0T26DRAFT_712390 [Lasiosphaeria miniovina]